MKKELRILIIEDLPSDAELATHELGTVLDNHTVQVVDTREGFLHALKTFKPDLILSDYNLPTFDGLSALRLAREKAPFLPFVILTGSMNEERAVECIKAGADDYVIKEHIKRLGQAVTGAIEKKKTEQERCQALQALHESERRFRKIYEESPFAYQSLDAKGRLLDVNPAWLELMGYSRNSVLGRRIDDFFTRESQAAFTLRFPHFRKNGKTPDNEFQVRRKNGEILDIVFDGVFVYDEQGLLSYTHCVLHDITDRKRSEEALKLSKERYRSLFDNSSDAILLHDLGGRIIDANQKALSIFGYDEREIKTLTIMQLHPEEESEKAGQAFQEISETGSINLEINFKKHNGDIFPAEISATIIEIGAQKVVLGIVRDITERKAAAAAIQESEEHYRTLIEQSSDAIYVLQDNRYVLVNNAWESMFGYSRKTALSPDFSFWQIISPKDRAIIEERAKRQQAGEAVDNFYEFRGVTRDKRELFLEVRVSDIVWDGQPAVQGVYRDVTERKRAEQELKQSEARYRSLIDQSQDAIYLLYENKFELINTRFTTMFGYTLEETQADDFNFRQLLAPESLPIIEERLERFKKGEKLAPIYEFVALAKDGTKIDCEVSTSYIDYLGGKATQGILRDISDRKRAEQVLAAQRRKLADIIRGTNAGTWDWNVQTDELLLNERWAEIIGYTLEDLAPISVQTWFDSVHPDDLPVANSHLEKHFKGELDYYDVEFRQRHKDGSWVWVNARGKVVEWSKDGKPLRMSGTHVDINEHKRAEERIARLGRIFEASLNEIYLFDADTFKFSNVNSAAQNNLGYTMEELEELTALDLKPEFTAESFEKLVTPLRKNEKNKIVFETVHKRKDQSRYNVQIHLQLLKFEQKLLFAAIVLDITEKKRADEALRKSEERFKRLFEDLGDAVFVTKISGIDQGQILECNLAAERQTGYTKEELLGMNIAKDLAVGDSGEISHFEWDEKLLNGEAVTTIEKKRRKDGAEYSVEVVVTPIEYMGTDACLSINRDITERLHAADELRKLSLAVEQSTASIMITNTDGDIEYVNPQFTKVTGYSAEEVKGKNPRFLQSGQTNPQLYEELWQRLTSGKNWRGEFINRKKNGDIFWESASIVPIKDANGHITHYLGIKEDISEKRKLEEQLRQSQKMEAVGQLAGGVAHDFNNLLTVINGYTEMLLARQHHDDPTAKKLQQIKRAGKRAAALTGQLLAFSRRQVLKMEVLDINDLISHSEEMLKRLIGEDIDLATYYGKELTAVEADAMQLEQIILNLAVNARDAMPDGGSLTIETRNIVLDETYASQHDEVKPGRYVLIAFSDNGVGMNKEIQTRIFEPFFTTKEKGRGTGLGLSTVYGIIKQSGGHISVYSEPENGTSFKVYLPAVDKKVQDVDERGNYDAVSRGTETILLVEDEEDVRTLAEQSLSGCGYHLITAVDGADGLEKARACKKKIHLLLADVIMPNMSGKQLADRIGEFHPESKICFMSGYTDDAILHQGVLDKGVNLIQKPFSLRELGKRVREVLDDIEKA